MAGVVMVCTDSGRRATNWVRPDATSAGGEVAVGIRRAGRVAAPAGAAVDPLLLSSVRRRSHHDRHVVTAEE
jgi:hypothetical protein